MFQNTMSQYFHGIKSESPDFSKRVIDEDTQIITDFVDLKKLPQFGLLSKQVGRVMTFDLSLFEKVQR